MTEMTDIAKRHAQIAQRVRTARENAGLSQGQAAKHLGLPRPSITEVEQGRRKVSAAELAAMAALYGVSIGWLACEDDDVPDAAQDQIQLAAREIASLKKDDLQAVLSLVRSLRAKRR
ncbi:MAG: helix-turn-helix transcriptional regulator [Myxococcales bacterium]|nr:helix-turn-helix transcriptional regulator [Myxococcales bacterium]